MLPLTRLITAAWVAASITLAAAPAAAGIVTAPYLNDTPATAVDVDGFFTTEFVAEIESGPTTNHSTTLPHVTVHEWSSDSYDYLTFTVAAAGTYGIFDIDQATLIDSYIWLLDTDGTTVLAENDDAPFDGPGDLTSPTTNSFLTYTFAAPGRYYLRIGEWPGTVFNHGNDLDYDVHISLGASPVPVPPAFALVGGVLPLIARYRRRHPAG